MSTDRPRRLAAAFGRIRTVAGLAAGAAPMVFGLYVFCTLLAGAMPVVTAWATKLVIDHIVAQAPTRTLLSLAAVLAGSALVTGVMPHVSTYLKSELDRRVGVLNQERLFGAVDRFVGIGRFENPNFLDHLRLAQQPAAAPPYPVQALDGVLGMTRSMFTVVGFVGSLYLISPLMTFLVLVSGLPALLAQISLSKRRAKVYWEVGPAERREFFYSRLLSSVEAAKEIRLFGIGGFLRDRMLGNRRAVNAEKQAIDKRQAYIQTSLGLMAALIAGGGLVWAVLAARAGSISVGDVTMFVAAVAGVQNAIASMARDFARAHQAFLLFEHYLEVLSAKPDLPVGDPPVPARPLSRGIELRDVWFRYSDDHAWALRGVDLMIPYGKSVGLVGRNGAGKSTLVKLLCRFYDPVRGAILWDGVDIRELDPTELRARIGAVFQDYMEYDLTATENIGLGDLQGLEDEHRLRMAAERAGIHPKLESLPDGYDTLLSRMFFMEAQKKAHAGVVLSGGEWQRLSLARALMRHERDLLILDEPSSGLDAEAEYRVHATLRTLREGRTSVLISHRLGAVRDADQLIVLSGGQVVEVGDHESLMRTGGEYQTLFEMQASGYRTGGESPSSLLPTALPPGLPAGAVEVARPAPGTHQVRGPC